ncbi:hypothetical protein LAJ19_14360 (plasmid) [Deinococcus taeanensis]|uniref:hypothetical protein n=1 Tax=Deinococcus taeanensis TaxID=2737050 RepID=UPI001CDD0291|nr:hypothetical protein [Deinococcus taeanensis]UBV44347.1 hypothetical protein LAJ19_14360 [Deinococcus taeanensis]
MTALMFCFLCAVLNVLLIVGTSTSDVPPITDDEWEDWKALNRPRGPQVPRPQS